VLVRHGDIGAIHVNSSAPVSDNEQAEALFPHSVSCCALISSCLYHLQLTQGFLMATTHYTIVFYFSVGAMSDVLRLQSPGAEAFIALC